MAEYKMCANEDVAIYILDFIKRGYEKRLNEDGQAGCQKYVEALQMGIDALGTVNQQKAEIERLKKSLDNMTDALIKTDEACRKADFEEVTRCKDCWNAEDIDGVLYCNHFNHNVYEDDFCSNGG